jgi:hypothetical protein
MTPPIEPSEPAAKDAVRAIAAQLSAPHTSMGLLSALRRFDPIKQGRQSLFETTQVLMQADIHPGDLHDRWALVVHCLALVRGAHDGRRNPGAAMAAMQFSEARLRQLVQADSALLFDLMPRLARRLAAHGGAVNWWPLTLMVLHTGRDEPRADKARSEVIAGYLGASARAAEAEPA